MSLEIKNPDASICDDIKAAILEEIPDAKVEVGGGGGHFTIAVCSSVFEGKRRLDQQRMVYKAITPLMSGDMAPVHAIDEMKIEVPE